MSDGDYDHDDDSPLTVFEVMVRLMESNPMAPVIIIDSAKGVPVPYRTGIGVAESIEGDSIPIFTIVIGDNIGELAEDGSIMFSAGTSFRPGEAT